MDMESIYRNFENTRMKKILETILAALFPVRNENNRAACERVWWSSYEDKHSLDPFRPFERGEEGIKKT